MARNNKSAIMRKSLRSKFEQYDQGDMDATQLINKINFVRIERYRIIHPICRTENLKFKSREIENNNNNI